MTSHNPQIADWVVHRPNIVRSVVARVPGIDAEEAASRALEKMVRIVSAGGTIKAPAAYWRHAAVNEALSMIREAHRARTVADPALASLVHAADGAELDAERQADVAMLRAALSDLAAADRTILVDRHVKDRSVRDIAAGLGVRPHAVTMRLRRAEERLAGAFAASHARSVDSPVCRAARAGMHDYLKGRLLPRRQQRIETHMDRCAGCTLAFIDVREVSWMLRDLGQHVLAAAALPGATGAAATGAAAAAGARAVPRGRSFGTREAAVASGVVAVLVLGGGAGALVAGQPDVQPFEPVGTGPWQAAAPPAPDLDAAPSDDGDADRDRDHVPPPDPDRAAAGGPTTADGPATADERAPERAPARSVTFEQQEPTPEHEDEPAVLSQPAPEASDVPDAPGPEQPTSPTRSAEHGAAADRPEAADRPGAGEAGRQGQQPAQDPVPVTRPPDRAGPPAAQPPRAPGSFPGSFPGASPGSASGSSPGTRPRPAPGPPAGSSPPPARPPVAARPGGPSGNPGSPHGHGPALERGQWPGSRNGNGPGGSSGTGHDWRHIRPEGHDRGDEHGRRDGRERADEYGHPGHRDEPTGPDQWEAPQVGTYQSTRTTALE